MSIRRYFRPSLNFWVAIFCAAMVTGGPERSLVAQQESTGGSKSILENGLGANATQNGKRQYPDVDDAIVLFRRGNVAGALSLLNTARKKHPQISPPEIMLARLYFANKQLNEGKAMLQTAAVNHSDDPETWNLLADLHLRNGNLAEADLLFHRAIEAGKKMGRDTQRLKNQYRFAFDGAARTMEIRKLWSPAEKILVEWRKTNPANVGLLRRLAAVQLHLEQLDAARETLVLVKKIDPKQLPADVSLGIYLQGKGKKIEAAENMQRALKEDPDSFGTQVAVAQWALTAGHTELARECIARCKTLEPESLIHKALDASADLFENSLENAERKFQELIKLKPGDFDVVNGLAFSLLKQDSIDKHYRALEHAKVLAKSNSNVRQPRGRQALTLLAWSYYRTGQIDQAEKLMQQVVNSGDLGPDTAYFCAEIFHHKNQDKVANELVTKALASPVAFIHRGEAEKLLQTLKNGQ